MNTSTQQDTRPILRVGNLAYYDGITCMIPCKVLTIEGSSGAASSEQSVLIKTTAKRIGFPKGTLFNTLGHNVVPRAAYFKRRYGARIGYYTVEVPTNK